MEFEIIIALVIFFIYIQNIQGFFNPQPQYLKAVPMPWPYYNPAYFPGQFQVVSLFLLELLCCNL